MPRYRTGPSNDLETAPDYAENTTKSTNNGGIQADTLPPKSPFSPYDNKEQNEEVQMTCCKRVLFGVVLGMAVLTLVAAAVAAALPYWTHIGISNDTMVFETSEGIFQLCTYPQSVNQSCGFIKYMAKPAFIAASAGLWFIAMTVMLSCGLTTLCLCTETCKDSKLCAAALTGGVLISALMFLAGLITWGIGSKARLNRDEVTHFDYSYYAAIAAGGLAFITTLILLLSLTFLYPNTYSEKPKLNDEDDDYGEMITLDKQ